MPASGVCTEGVGGGLGALIRVGYDKGAFGSNQKAGWRTVSSVAGQKRPERNGDEPIPRPLINASAKWAESVLTD